MKHIINAIGWIGFIIMIAIRIVLGIQFDQNCEGHLKRAADANTVELAKSELNIAIKYLEQNNLTTGYTSVLWKTPDEDIAFWYNNLVASYTELCELPEDASNLEKTNMLMKLRETLTDDGEKGVTITVPTGLSRYPHNALFGILTLIFGLIACGITSVMFIIFN